jgi:predicted amidohydrolase
MKAAFLQSNPSFGEKGENLKKAASMIRYADVDLLVLPEFFATGYQFISRAEVSGLSESIPDGETTAFLAATAREKAIYITAGLPERDGDRFYNSAVLVGPDGFIGSYRKTHLYSEETLYFSPGDTGFRVWDTPIGKIGIMICFDWFFPESARTLALMGAEIIAHPANLVLPYCPQSMPVRCLENGVFAVTANRIGTEHRKEGEPLTYIGQSQIVSPKAEILVRAPEDLECLMTAELDPATARDKSLNPFNNLFHDRRPNLYFS